MPWYASMFGLPAVIITVAGIYESFNEDSSWPDRVAPELYLGVWVLSLVVLHMVFDGYQLCPGMYHDVVPSMFSSGITMTVVGLGEMHNPDWDPPIWPHRLMCLGIATWCLACGLWYVLR